MDLQLLLALGLGIATVVFVVLATRLDAFVGLLLAALVTGFVAGSPALDTITSMTTGFGTTLSSIGIVIGSAWGSARSSRSPAPPTRWPCLRACARPRPRALGDGRHRGRGVDPGVLRLGLRHHEPAGPLDRPPAQGPLRHPGARAGLRHDAHPPPGPAHPGPLGVAGILGADLGALVLAGLVFSLLLLPVVVAYAAWMGPSSSSVTPRSARPSTAA